MNSLNIKIKPAHFKRKLLLELDADKFESLAARFGFFNPDFISSVEKSEKDYLTGKIREITSLTELRKRPRAS